MFTNLNCPARVVQKNLARGESDSLRTTRGNEIYEPCGGLRNNVVERVNWVIIQPYSAL